MFHILRKNICFFTCAVVLASASIEMKVNAGFRCKAASITLGTFSTMLGLINLLQASGIDIFVNDTDADGKCKKEEGTFGLYGPIGKWIGRPYSGEIRGKKTNLVMNGKEYYSYDDDSQEAGKLAPVVTGIGKIVLGVGGIALGVIG